MVLQIIAKLTRGEPILPVTDTTKIKGKRSDEADSENNNSDAEGNIQEQPSISPVNVIYQTAEDGLGDTIKPRLLAAGADCSKVLVIDDSDQPLTILKNMFHCLRLYLAMEISLSLKPAVSR